MAAIMKTVNQKVRAGHLWSFEGAGKFLITPERAAAWIDCPGRHKPLKFNFEHYFGKKDGDDRAPIHDECNKAFPIAFTNSGVSSSSWRSASQAEILTFVKTMFVKPFPLWLSDKWGNWAQCCAVSLSKT